MPEELKFDILLSRSSKGKPVMRRLASTLAAGGVPVWLDKEQIKLGDSISAKIQPGLEYSRVMVLSVSANVFGSDRAHEAAMFRFRDPLMQESLFVTVQFH